VVSDLVAALDRGAQGLRVKLEGPPGVKIVALTLCASNNSISRQMPTRPPNSPFASCIGGSFKRRRSSIESKSRVKLTAIRTPDG